MKGKKLVRSLMFVAAYAALAVTSPIRAIAEETGDQPTNNPWKYWLGAGAVFYEADAENESGQLYEARVSYDLDPAFTFEVGFGGSPFIEGNDFGAPSDKETTFNSRNSPGENWFLKGNIGALYHFNQEENRKWDPYVTLAMGGAQWYDKRRQGSNWEPFGGPGVGVSYWFDKDFALRLNYDVVVAGYSNSDINHHVLGMVYYKFGGGDEGGAAEQGKDNSEMGTHAAGPLKPIYFDYDKSNLTSQSQSTLKENAQYMKSNPAQKVSLEGHCDERGTNEYNLALGARRAKSAFEYLRTLGIPSEQMSTVSYGEEFPADPGHNEAAWSKNRRVESVIKK
ncbi:MAG: peptidoglycan-associated lipoprotein Pal [Bdellovibrionota bacterium]